MITIDLCGKTALITGGAGGIGKACAELLSKAGAFVIISDINEQGAHTAAESLNGGCGKNRANGGENAGNSSNQSADLAAVIPCDMGSEESILHLCKKILDDYAGVDMIINCAGVISYRKGLQAVTFAEWRKVMEINLNGSFLLCRELLEPMKNAGWGRVIHLSSLAARVGGIEAGVHYSASKAGLIGLTKTMAKEGAPYGVTVNVLAPGIIATGPVLDQVGDHLDNYNKTIPLGRLGKPEDIANAVLFFCSPLSDYITGITLDINGGLFMG